MFLMLGVIYSVMGFISVILISEPEPHQQPPKDITNTNGVDKSIELSEKGVTSVKKDEISAKNVFSLSPFQVLRTPIFYQVS